MEMMKKNTDDFEEVIKPGQSEENEEEKVVLDKIEIPELAPIDQVDSESLESGSPEEKLETATKDESPLKKMN